jgi:hypothetical protein
MHASPDALATHPVKKCVTMNNTAAVPLTITVKGDAHGGY